MGVNVGFRGGRHGPGDTDLCTNKGLSLIYDWIGSLPSGEYPALESLADRGYYEDTERLASELQDAIGRVPVDDPAGRHAVERLLSLIGLGDASETMVISS